MPKAKTAPKRKANGYKMPDPLPKGEILQDLLKKQWRLGPSIGKGGFGEIYSAQAVESKGTNYPYVVKIEPHANGPLFVEMHFYSKNAKQVDIDAFKADKKINTLGMPAYIGSGSHEYNGEKYRFVVIEKFATDIWKLYQSNNKKFPEPTVYKLGLQMIDVLEYIHTKGYVHADIKGANILLGGKNQNQAYLVDFGLVGRYSTETEFKPNPKKMHDGTIEYLSRDAHKGVLTRRGDIEILAYNMMHWLGCVLPWEKNLSDPKIVQSEKEKYMSDISMFLMTCFEKSSNTDIIKQLLELVNIMKFNEAPDYDKIRNIFKAGLISSGGKESSPLQFKSVTKRKSASGKPTAANKIRKKANVSDDEDSQDIAGEDGEIKYTPQRKKTVGRKKKATKIADSENEMDSSSNDEHDIVIKPTKRRGVVKSSSDNSELEKTPKSRGRNNVTKSSGDKRTPKRNNSKTPTAPREENGVIHNREMMRIKNLAAQKYRKKANPVKSVINGSVSNSEGEEVIPVSRRATRKQ